MVIAGIVAGGTGTRLNQSLLPKQFIEIGEKPIIIHTIEKFLVSNKIDLIIVGVHSEWLSYATDLFDKYFQGNQNITVVSGGENRNDTIKNIVEVAQEKYHADDESIMVTHDAVRPFLSIRIIEENIEKALEYDITDTVVSASDTIVQSDDSYFISDIPIRSSMYQGQTPQSFKVGVFNEVYQLSTKDELNIVTDVCKLFHLKKKKVYMVKGELDNFKITYPFDLKIAKIIVQEKKPC